MVVAVEGQGAVRRLGRGVAPFDDAPLFESAALGVVNAPVYALLLREITTSVHRSVDPVSTRR